MQNSKIVILFILMGIITININSSDSSYLPDKKYILGAAAVAALSVPAYYYYSKYRPTQPEKSVEKKETDKQCTTIFDRTDLDDPGINGDEIKKYIQTKAPRGAHWRRFFDRNLEQEEMKYIKDKESVERQGKRIPENKTIERLKEYMNMTHQERMEYWLNGAPESFKLFIQLYSPSPEVLQDWVMQEKTFYNHDASDKYNASQEDFFVKNFDIFRIINARRIKNYIQQKNYMFVDVPKKYIFLTGDSWIVIAQKIKPLKDLTNYKISEQAIDELSDIVTTMGFSDFGLGQNLIIGEDGKIWMIDVEKDAFNPLSDKGPCYNKYFNLIELKNSIDYLLDSKARELLDKKIADAYKAYRSTLSWTDWFKSFIW